MIKAISSKHRERACCVLYLNACWAVVIFSANALTGLLRDAFCAGQVLPANSSLACPLPVSRGLVRVLMGSRFTLLAVARPDISHAFENAPDGPFMDRVRWYHWVVRHVSKTIAQHNPVAVTTVRLAPNAFNASISLKSFKAPRESECNVHCCLNSTTAYLMQELFSHELLQRKRSEGRCLANIRQEIEKSAKS